MSADTITMSADMVTVKADTRAMSADMLTMSADTVVVSADTMSVKGFIRTCVRGADRAIGDATGGRGGFPGRTISAVIGAGAARSDVKKIRLNRLGDLNRPVARSDQT